jgi:hypothetical protein
MSKASKCMSNVLMCMNIVLNCMNIVSQCMNYVSKYMNKDFIFMKKDSRTELSQPVSRPHQLFVFLNSADGKESKDKLY